MGTVNKFKVYIAGSFIGSAWSLHAANEKLTAAILVRAHERGSFPVDGHIFNGLGIQVTHRQFPGFWDESGVSHGN